MGKKTATLPVNLLTELALDESTGFSQGDQQKFHPRSVSQPEKFELQRDNDAINYELESTPCETIPMVSVASKKPMKWATLIKRPVPWGRTDPALEFGASFFGGYREIHPMDFVHGAAFGATGSGKTENVVKPFISAALKYRLNDGTQASVFVIDPKKELVDSIRSALKTCGEQNRLVVIGECKPIALFPKDCQLSATDRFELYREVVPAENSIDNQSWKLKADALLIDILELELAFFESSGHRFMATLARNLEIPDTEGSSFWVTVRAVLAFALQGQKKLNSVAKSIEKLCADYGVMSPSIQLFASFTGGSDTVDQACYVVMSAQSTVNALSNLSIEAFVDLDVLCSCEPRTNLQELIEAGKVLVFQPEQTTAHAVAAKALKQNIFEAIYKRNDMRRPVFFIADEYQMFVSAKDTSLFDRSRSYRCVSLLASQSIASLKHALGNTLASSNIVDVLVTNLPTRFSFRSNCVETAVWLRSQIPNAMEGPHILDVRRLATLKPGQAYFMLADGRWGFDRPSLPLAA